MKTLDINSEFVVVGNDEYPLKRMLYLWSHQLTLKCQLIRLVSVVVQFSTMGWLAQFWVASVIPYGFALLLPSFLAGFGVLYYLYSFRRFELRVRLTEVDETGSQVIAIARTRKKQDFTIFKELEKEWGKQFV
ncbi:hypothetical protein RJY08_001446 [Vibrio alginolyticus]|uniref:hypothetical protein n=1 Tax=Vibrio sp. 16 TaxID=391586 RepID=UPI00285E7BEF|nr:hypothetical protein [Vibrio alginolyticus]